MDAHLLFPQRRIRMRLIKTLVRELSAVLQIGGWRCFMTYVGQILYNAPAIAKSKSLAPADRGMIGGRYTFKIFGQNIFLDGALFGGAREIYGRKVYFALPDFRLRSTDVVVDLGANAGVFTVLAGRL